MTIKSLEKWNAKNEKKRAKGKCETEMKKGIYKRGYDICYFEGMYWEGKRNDRNY